MICKQCGEKLTEVTESLAYCKRCKINRFRPCPEIDKETGEWEGMTHGN